MNREQFLIEEPSRITVYRVGRTLYFFDDVSSESVCEAVKILDNMERESKKEIQIVLDTHGGYCYDGLALYDKIRHCQCQITIIGTGIVASMGFIIYLAGDTRLLMPNCILMNHQISSNPDGKLGDLKIELEEMKRIDKRCTEIISERTGQATKVIENKISKGDDYITPERAIKEKIAHGLVKVTKKSRRK